jgi:hypothetical protein
MKPTNYSHESQFSGERLDMYVRLQMINMATDGSHSATLSEYPDLAQPTIQRAAEAGANLVSQSRTEYAVTTTDVPSAVVVPPVERPRIVMAAPVIARTEEETHLEEQRVMGVDALARANREAL